ncbi:glutamate carboxypeptidase [Noviherbaspirillum humi]|uniref:Glutamate carboxypeptidase n=2 Tax=Noviherbaspirillum humi TaxID=1688639 RepID=A0A239HRE7_9BURK|nr:glutamate carboxypeptidase [Noviherbaspirillum humi]
MKSCLLACGILSLSAAAFAAPDKNLLALAEAHKPAFIEELKTLVNIDSGTDDAKGLGQVEQLLATRLKELGANVDILAAPPAAGKVVVGTLEGSGTKSFMLMIHYDTVFSPGDAAKRPFRMDGNKAYGPGVADAKGGAAMIIHGLQMLKERSNRQYKRITVVFNPDEEKSSLGSRAVITRLAPDHDYVFSYEPPEKENVAVATNGIAYVHLNVKGKASHAGSAPEQGRNAAIELANQLVQLKDLGNPAKGTTVNWTVLQSGEKVNIIPDSAKATADMRMSDLTEIERVQRDASAIVQKKLIPETEVTVRVENRRPPFSKNPASDKLATVAQTIYQELGQSLTPVSMRFGTDAGFAYQGNGKPAVLETMGIVGERIHSADEFADLDSIVPRLYLTVRMIETLSQSVPD